MPKSFINTYYCMKCGCILSESSNCLCNECYEIDHNLGKDNDELEIDLDKNYEYDIEPDYFEDDDLYYQDDR